MATWGWYSNASLTTELTQLEARTLPYTDFRLWYGAPETGTKIEATSDPGVDDLVISIADSDVGTGQETTAVQLADSLAGLDTAVAGDPLTIGTSLLSGSANAFELYVRVTDELGSVGSSTELSLEITDWTESAV
jgi:hypothetical protein